MPLSPLPYREVKRKLETAGFTEVSQRGSDVKFVKASDASDLGGSASTSQVGDEWGKL